VAFTGYLFPHRVLLECTFTRHLQLVLPQHQFVRHVVVVLIALQDTSAVEERQRLFNALVD
jgi:hypothetical protein